MGFQDLHEMECFLASSDSKAQVKPQLLQRLVVVSYSVACIGTTVRVSTATGSALRPIILWLDGGDTCPILGWGGAFLGC